MIQKPYENDDQQYEHGGHRPSIFLFEAASHDCELAKKQTEGGRARYRCCAGKP